MKRNLAAFGSVLCLLWLSSAGSLEGETWQEALSRMPLRASAGEFNRTNCLPLMLNAFQSNGVVKAVIFMPGATDELDFFRRARPVLAIDHASLLDAVAALTNQTHIQATFQPPLLLLHTTEDPLNVIADVEDESTAAKLRKRIEGDRVLLIDADWSGVRTALKGKLGVGLRPFPNALDTWHFYRHNFVACGATDWEMLETLALAGKTTFTVNWLTADFKPDRRQGVVPKLDQFPMR